MVSKPTWVAQMVKNLPETQETQIRPLGQEDPLEKAVASHSSILAWRIPWTEDPGRLWSTGSQGDMTEATQHTQHTAYMTWDLTRPQEHRGKASPQGHYGQPASKAQIEARQFRSRTATGLPFLRKQISRMLTYTDSSPWASGGKPDAQRPGDAPENIH